MPRQKHTEGAPSFASLSHRPQFQQRAATIFPSLSALDWFIRLHRAELAGCGAIVKIRNEVLIDEEKFPEAVKSIGAKLAGIDPK